MKKSKYTDKMIDLVEKVLQDMNASEKFTIGEKEDTDLVLELEHDASRATVCIDLSTLYRQKEEEDVKCKDQFNDHVAGNVRSFVEQWRDYVPENRVQYDDYDDEDEDYEDDEYEEDEYDEDDDYDDDYDEEDYEESDYPIGREMLRRIMGIEEDNEEDEEYDDEDDYEDEEEEENVYDAFVEPDSDTNREELVEKTLIENNESLLDENYAEFSDFKVQLLKDAMPYFLTGTLGDGIVVLNNKESDAASCGALQMKNPRAMRAVSKVLGTEDFYIVPSSVNEVICVKKSCHINEEALKDMLHTINHTIKPELVFSDKIYQYDFDNFELVTVEDKKEELDDSEHLPEF